MSEQDEVVVSDEIKKQLKKFREREKYIEDNAAKWRLWVGGIGAIIFFLLGFFLQSKYPDFCFLRDSFPLTISNIGIIAGLTWFLFWFGLLQDIHKWRIGKEYDKKRNNV